MSTLSKIKHLYAYEDGDVITPGMGVEIADGYGLNQYYNKDTMAVIETDFSEHPATLFPQPWSSKRQKMVAPSTTGQQWYYGSVSDAAGILDANGNVKTQYASLFEKTTKTIGQNTFPALKIKGNLVGPGSNDLTNRHIYYTGSYEGKTFTCQQEIGIYEAVGNVYEVLLSVTSASGNGDDTLDADNDYVTFSAYLQRNGVNAEGTATFTFQRLVNGSWVNITNTSGLTEIGNASPFTGNKLTLHDAAVEGTEVFRAKVVHASITYYKTFEVRDTHDPKYIDDGCSILGDSVKPTDTITFNPKVIVRETGEVEDGWSFEYTVISRTTGEAISGVSISGTTGSGLTYDVINQHGGVSVRIEATQD